MGHHLTCSYYNGRVPLSDQRHYRALREKHFYTCVTTKLSTQQATRVRSCITIRELSQGPGNYVHRVLTIHYIIPSYKRGRNVYVQLRNLNKVATCKIQNAVPLSEDVSFSLFRFLPLPQVVAGIVQAPGPDPLEGKTPLYGALTRPATEECRGFLRLVDGRYCQLYV